MIPIAKPSLGKEEISAVAKVLRSGSLVQGEKAQEFEKRFASFIGTKHAIACSNGTAALQVGLEALGIREGDEVVTTPFTFIASSNCILYNRAKPVFADIDARTFNIDPAGIEALLTPQTRAVLVVHLYGQPCDLRPVMDLCRDRGLLLIEDCAQAHGAEYRGRKAGSFGDLSAFSFYATKNMTTGEGGMMMTGDDAVAEKARMIINQGQEGRYEHVVLGYNYRLTEMQAAIGSVQLRKLAAMNSKRERNAGFLTRKLSGLGWLETPYAPKGVKPVWHQYTIKVDATIRDRLFEHLNSKGVGARIYYPKPVHLQPLYRSLGYEEGICPVAEFVSRQVISLPVHPALGNGDLRRIVAAVESFRAGS